MLHFRFKNIYLSLPSPVSSRTACLANEPENKIAKFIKVNSLKLTVTKHVSFTDQTKNTWGNQSVCSI